MSFTTIGGAFTKAFASETGQTRAKNKEYQMLAYEMLEAEKNGKVEHSTPNGEVQPIGKVTGNSPQVAQSHEKPLRSTKEYEGWRSHVYKDTEGYDTIGYGHKLTKSEIASGKYRNGITREQGDKLYEEDHNRIADTLYTKYPWVKDLPEEAKIATVDMAYNMGPAWLDKFPKARKALESGDYVETGKEIYGTKYYNQVGQRAKDNIQRFEMAAREKTGTNFDKQLDDWETQWKKNNPTWKRGV